MNKANKPLAAPTFSPLAETRCAWYKAVVRVSEKASLGGYKNTMTTYQHLPKDITPCPACGGSGETAFFGGESRFMLTREDCPDCCGTGVLLPATEPKPSPGETKPPEVTP